MLALDFVQHFFLGVNETASVPIPLSVPQPKGGDQGKGTKQDPAQEPTTPAVPFASSNGGSEDAAQNPEDNSDHWSPLNTSLIRF